LHLLVVVYHAFDAVLALPLTQLGDDRPPKELAEILLAVNLRHQRGTVHAATAALAHVGDPLTSLRVEVAAVTETARDDQLIQHLLVGVPAGVRHLEQSPVGLSGRLVPDAFLEPGPTGDKPRLHQ